MVNVTEDERRRAKEGRLARLAGGRVLLMGRAGMDFYADPPGTPAERAERFVAHLGGSSANVAVALARQGLRSSLLTVVSDDPAGRFCLHALVGYGVDVTHVHLLRGEARTSLAVTESRAEDCQSVIYRNDAADFHVAPAHVAAVDFGAFDAFALTGTALAAEPSRSAAFLALERARDAGLATILDLDYRPYSWRSAAHASASCAEAARRCDLVVGNDEEFDVVAGGGGRGEAAARALADECGSVVVYKRGACGALVFREGRVQAHGVYRVAALKPTGAGDAFLGGMLAALAQRRPMDEAVRRGSAAAAIVVTRVGCAPAMPTTAELDAFLADPAHRPGPGPGA